MPSATLIVRDLWLRLGERRIGGDPGLSLSLHEGQSLRLSGPSGAGKSTLLRAIAGLIDAEGELLLGDPPQSPAELGYPQWRRQVMLVGQRPIATEGSVRQNLARPFSFASAKARFDAEEAEARIEALGVSGAFEREASKLSGGELQRVHLLRGLLLRPQVLLADEPTSSLDPESAEAVARELSRFTEEGGALLFVSHDATLAERLRAKEIRVSDQSIEGNPNA